MKLPRAMKCAAVVGMVLFLVHAGGAWAATETQGPNTQGPFSGSTSGSFTLPQFDTFGGTRTLTGVTVQVSIDSSGGKSEFDNQSSTGGTITLAIGSSVRVKGPIPGVGTQIIVIPDAVSTASASVTGTTGDIPADFAGTDYAFVNGPTSPAIITDLKSDARTLAGDLVPYIGTGNVSFNWDLAGISTTGQDVSVTGGGSFRITAPTYSFHTTVLYDYVPEPASLALLAPAMLLAALRRRR